MAGRTEEGKGNGLYYFIEGFKGSKTTFLQMSYGTFSFFSAKWGFRIGPYYCPDMMTNIVLLKGEWMLGREEVKRKDFID